MVGEMISTVLSFMSFKSDWEREVIEERYYAIPHRIERLQRFGVFDDNSHLFINSAVFLTRETETHFSNCTGSIFLNLLVIFSGASKVETMCRFVQRLGNLKNRPAWCQQFDQSEWLASDTFGF